MRTNPTLVLVTLVCAAVAAATLTITSPTGVSSPYMRLKGIVPPSSERQSK